MVSQTEEALGWTAEGQKFAAANSVESQLDGSTYFIKPAMDQRTELEKIQEDIIPAVKSYLENPSAPSKEQTIEFLKTAAGDTWETISIPGDLLSGKKNLGDVTLGQLFEVTGGMAAGSTLGKVPDGNSSNTMRMFGSLNNPGKSKKETNPLVKTKEDAFGDDF